MSSDKLVMGRAYNIAQRARFKVPELGMEMYIFTEDEMREFVRVLLTEQKHICAASARDAIAHPLAEAQLAGTIIEAAPDAEAI